MVRITLPARHNDGRGSAGRWLAITALGWLAMTLGLFTATVAGNAVRASGATDNEIAVVQAFTAALLIVPAVCLIQRRFRLSARLLRLTPATFLHLLGGGALALLMGGLGFIITGALGWTTIIAWDFSVDLLLAVAFSTSIAFLYEALPEELSMRGIVYSGLRLRLPAYAAYCAQVLLFVLVPVTVNQLQAWSGLDRGNSINAEYVIMLLCFGTVLQLWRSLTGSLWASIGFHLTYLAMARFVILQREQRLLTYNELEAGTGPVVIQFGIIIVGSAVLLVLLNLWRRGRRRTASQ
ncbi:CPBP family glutamic-type intramembrane protease [Paenibacillus sp. FSL R7-277]|uniref:CPBP family glutamic-type intramembrane protease n=1 Tax=Paenibacillus sp. FSL R7-277 TaxID=1227352 RepID=UPI0004BA2E96|nr:CPBP family glutamic-type intramembrane protease [Paenibacillus sp. FSL R7-277]